MGGVPCYATNQARAALLIALKSLGLSKNDEVIVPSFTYKGVIDAILEAGASPVFVDSSLKDLNAHSEEIEERITQNTKVIIATHLFGIPTDIEAISALSSENNCVLIEDCAQCLGALYRKKRVGTFGDMSIVSFNFEKHMTTGEGGMLIVNNRELLNSVSDVINAYTRVPLSREKYYTYGLLLEHIVTDKDTYGDFRIPLSATFGQECCMIDSNITRKVEQLIQTGVQIEELKEKLLPYMKMNQVYLKAMVRQNLIVGTVLNRVERMKTKIRRPPGASIESEQLLMNSMRAAVGLIGLSIVDEINRVRNENARQFHDTFKDSEHFTSPVLDGHSHPCFLKYNLLSNSPYTMREISKRAREHGLELGNYQWGQPTHTQNPYQTCIQFDGANLKKSEYIASNIVNIPVHYSVSSADIKMITNFLGGLVHSR